MKKTKLEIFGLSFSQTQSGAYALVLGEENGNRRLPIIIGGFEAQAIAVEIEKMRPHRPLTHDLFKNFAETFDISISEVIIYNLKDGIFYSKLICTDGEKVVEIDGRTSDAIAMAVRFNCPIYTYEFILSQAGVIIDESTMGDTDDESAVLAESSQKKPFSEIDDLSKLSMAELKDSLKRVIEEEDYETASKIRDELKKRKQS